MELNLKVRAELLAERARLEEENLMIREKIARIERMNAEALQRIAEYEKELQVIETFLKGR